MAQSMAEIGEKLEAMRETLADAVVARHDLHQPNRSKPNRREDAVLHLTHLAQSLRAAEPALFREYVAWAKVMLCGRGVATRDLAENLKVTDEVLKELLPADDASAACQYVEAAIAELSQMADILPSFIAPAQPFSQLAKSYLAALLGCERQKASRLIMDAVKSGTSIKDIYIHVFQQSQKEIGRLWQINQINVAQEHYCTAATQLIMSQLYPLIFAVPRIGKSFVGACVAGDLHEIGIRMVADFFEMEGWDTVYLGANVPIADLIQTLVDRKPDVVGISATITPHVSTVAQMISAIRATPSCRNIKILVGGYPFLVAPELWKQVDADGTCMGAQHAVDLAKQLIGLRGIAA